jgi:hypothetical protein
VPDNLKIQDPWLQTIGMMRGRTHAGVALRSLCEPGGFGRALVVSVIERPTSTTAVIYWSDATRCCYCDQTWRTARARKQGVCAMSGQPIAPGDFIYVPRRRSAVCNGHAMILATVIERATLC